jgi:hypothetical protein
LVAFATTPFKAPPKVISTAAAAAAAEKTIHAGHEQPKLVADPDERLFHHVRQCTFSKLSETCTVCTEILMVKRNGKILQLDRCGHCFHENCLRSALQQQRQSSPTTRSCPTCRVSLLDDGESSQASVVADAA